MKRPIESTEDDPSTVGDLKMKKIKQDDSSPAPEKSSFVLMDENLLYEVMKHADARTLATAACVSKQWLKTSQDERLWELICTKHWANIGCGNQQLRSVVLALGGFRRLHSLYIWPFFKPSPSSSVSSGSVSGSSSSGWPCLPPPRPVVAAKSTGSGSKTRWGKDEVHLSLSLLSIRHYEKMSFNNRAKGN